MPSTTGVRRGDVVLVRFVFADELGVKRRPVLVLSADEYHADRAEIVVAAITSNVGRLLPGDGLLKEWRRAGLAKPSVATGILRTIKAAMIDATLGAVAKADLGAVEDRLRRMLGLA